MDITTQTQWCGIIGNPVEHSLSPAIHNAAFQKMGLDLVYLAFRVEALGDAMKGLRALGNARGFSVTIPHKVAAIPFLDEVEPTAKHIGAINTIVVRPDGSLQPVPGPQDTLGHGDIAVVVGRPEQVRAFAKGGSARIQR